MSIEEDEMVREPQQALESDRHKADTLLRPERLPHIWCPGCGLGVAVKAYVLTLEELEEEIPLQNQVVVSGIGCSGRIAGYVNIDSYHTTHGRAIPFATGIKLANSDLSVTVFSGDGDLLTIGGNHFIQAARRNMDINVFLVNNFIYGMTGGQYGATTPHETETATSPYGNFEEAMNAPALAESLGAPYIARWTTFHVRQLAESMERAFERSGFSLVEIISPCPPGFGRKNEFPEGLDMMEHFQERSVLAPDIDLKEAGLSAKPEDSIYVGEFVDREAVSYLEREEKVLEEAGLDRASEEEVSS